MWNDFKAFIAKGSMIDMAVGVIIGGAFGAIIASLVGDVLMPPLSLLLGKTDFSNLYLLLQDVGGGAPYATLADAQMAGAVTLNYGLFVNALINFLILALVIFMLVRWTTQLQEATKKKEEAEAPAAPDTKDCAYCLSEIPAAATKCRFCTSEV